MGGGAPPAKAEELATPVVQGLLSVGVLCCFSVSSLTQEALTSKRYGAEEAPFHFKNFLLFAQSVAAAAVALGMLARPRAPRAAGAGDGERHYARWVIVVGAYYASHWLGLASLHHLSYPVHVTFKSCKAIPVVIGERLLTTKRHGAAKLCGVFAMCVGVALFLLFTPEEAAHAERSTSLRGVVLVVGALLADGTRVRRRRVFFRSTIRIRASPGTRATRPRSCRGARRSGRSCCT